jgi:hypothetical protein
MPCTLPYSREYAVRGDDSEGDISTDIFSCVSWIKKTQYAAHNIPLLIY